MKFLWRIGLRWVVLAMLLMLSVEIGAELAYRAYKGSWYFQDRRKSFRALVQPHPYFGACLIPNISEERNGIRISHNSFRCRGAEFARPKPAGVFRIVALGGSTTYGTGVSDDQTWEVYLAQELGHNVEVINFANAGGTSLEASLQTALLFSDVQPDVALYYLGWNDARVQHVKNLWPDWSDFHGKWVMAFGLSGKEMETPLAAGYLMRRAAFHYFFPRMDLDKFVRNVEGDEWKLTDRLDERALSLYERNLRNITALCAEQKVTPVFIPQVMNYRVLTNDTPYGFLPFVRDKDLKEVIPAYNERLQKVSKEQRVGFIGDVLDQNYTSDDFLDQGHFTPDGNKKFANVLSTYLKKSIPRVAGGAAK